AADLKKKLAKGLQPAFSHAVHERLASHSLPATVGMLRIKKKDHLFLLRDVNTAAPLPAEAKAAPAAPPPAKPAAEEPSAAFAAACDEAYARLDRERGGSDFVSLVDLRRALPYDRATFDRELRVLRREGRYTLSTAEGRHGLTPE